MIEEGFGSERAPRARRRKRRAVPRNEALASTLRIVVASYIGATGAVYVGHGGVFAFLSLTALGIIAYFGFRNPGTRLE